jgi:hypothetical protein
MSFLKSCSEMKITAEYHTVFRMLETREHFPFNTLMEINVLDLTKVSAEAQDGLADWLRFIWARKADKRITNCKKYPY